MNPRYFESSGARRLFGLLACLAAAACGGGGSAGRVASTSTPAAAATCRIDADCAAPAFCSRGTCGALSVRIAVPNSDVLSRCLTTLDVEAVVEGTAPVDLLELVYGEHRWQLGAEPTGFACALADGTFDLRVVAHSDRHLVSSEPRRVTIDRVSPTVAWDPPPGVGIQPAARELVATFSEPIDPATFVPGTAFVNVYPDGLEDPPPFLTLAPDARSITVHLPRPLSEYRVVWVGLDGSANLADRAGNRVSQTRADWLQTAVLVRVETSPLVAGEFATGGVVSFFVDATGTNAQSIQLAVYGPPLGSETRYVPLPSLVSRWDLDAETAGEGTYLVTAMATRGAEWFYGSAPPVTVDRTRPTASIRHLGPVVAGGTVPPEVPFEVEFSEPVLPWTVTSRTIRAIDGADRTVPLRVDYVNPSGWAATVRRESMPFPGESIRVMVDGGITDRAGHALVPTSATFTYGP